MRIKFSGFAQVKILGKNTQNTMMLEPKLTLKLAILDVRNSSMKMGVFDPKDILGILNLRSMGYYKIKQGILQQNLSKYYRFELANTIWKQFNRFIIC